MADKKEWSLTEVKKSGVVTSKTATYTVDGKVAAVISGLSPEINTNSSKDQISGITVTEIASGGVIELSASVLNKAKVTLTQKNGYKYTLDVNTNVPAVTAENAEMTYSTKSNLGTITVKGNLTEGYTLASNGKSIAYAAAKTAQTLATISNLNGSLITDSDDGKIGEGEDGQVETAAVTLSGNTITLTQDALTNKNATLKLSNGSAFKLALNGVSAPTMNGEWTYKSGNATYTGTVSESGYVLSKDGKTVTYTAENDTAKALITVKGVVEPSEGTAGIAFQGEDNEIAHDANNFVTVVLPAAVLNKKNVTISGTGVNLALDNDVTDSDVKETNLWSVSGTTATYKTAKPEYYTYDATKNQVVYTKQADKKTLATVSNLASGLTTAVTYDKNTHKISGGDYLIGFGNEGSVIVDDDGNPDKLVSVNSSGVITLKAEALNAKNVTLKNGADAKYKLKLDNSEDNEIPRPTTSNEVWSVSGTTATLKGNTTGGYFETDDNTITFAKAFENDTQPTTLVTVKGLKKGVSLNTEDNTIGIAGTDDNGEPTFAQGLVLVDGTGSRTIRLSQNVLGTTDVSISPAAGYGDYHFALYKNEPQSGDNPEEYQAKIAINGGYVTTEAVETKVFAPAGSKVSIKKGTATYYTLSEDGKTLVCTPGTNEGAEIASIKGLKNTLRADAEGKVDGIELVGNNIKIGKDVLNNATVTFGSNTGKFVLSLAADAPKPHETTVWDVLGTTALLEKATSAGYTPNSSGTELTYSAEKHGSTLATITGLRTGLTVKDGKIDGIQIGTVDEDGDITDENIITLSAKALGQTDVEIYNETADKSSDEYYQLKIDSGSVAVTEVVGDGWKVSAPNNKGICTATYTVNTTKAGFAVPDNEESGAGAAATDDTSELGSGLKFVYKKKGKVTSTITGVAADSENFISTPDENGIITLSADALNPESSTVLTLKKPSGYKLALDDDVDEPKIKTGSFKWTLKKTTATLSGEVEKAGWEASADGFTVSYLAKPDDDATNKSTTLATITGIQSGISDDVLNAGITREGSVLTLSQEVLGASKIAVSSGKYAIKLDDEVATEAVDATEWVTSGTTATYKTYKRGYYTPASDTLINFTKPTTGTPYATIKGIKSGATVTGDTKTVTLGADQLGTSKVTITGTGYSLKLDTTTSNKVATAPAEGEGWVTSGTTATYKKYTKAYYTPSGNTAIVYHAPSKGTTYATVSGIKSGAEITSDGAGLITLTKDQLAEKKVTLKGDGYKLALDENVPISTGSEVAGEYGWNQKVKSTSATYVQTFSVGYTLADDAKSIAYTNKPTEKTLATLSGIKKADEEVNKGEITGIDFEVDDDGNQVITLSTNNFEKNKVTLKSDTYKLGQGELAEVGGDDDPTWSLNSKKGTAIYQQNFKEGYTVSDDGKTITKSEATTTDLATISGLNKDALKYFINNGDGTETTKDDVAADALPGFTVTTGNTNVITLSKPTDDESGSLGDYDSLLGTSKKITLGKKDTFEFALDDSLLTAAGANKWTVSGTTATYSSSTTDGYKTTDSKTVTYVKAAPSDVLISISGLKKGLKTDGTNVGTATKNSDGTYSYSQGITLRDSKSGYYKIDLGSEVLGTTNITLTNNTKDIYEFDKITGNTNPTHTLSWSYSNGTATYKDTQTSGYELSASKDAVNYTAAATTTLATVSGLVKGFTGDIDDAIKVDTSNIITIKSGLLGTSKVSLKPGKGLTYSLDLDGGVAQYPQTKNAQWVTSGTTATYKDYQDAYYTISSDGKSISYVKPKDITVYATVKGIKSGVDITDSFSGDKTNGGTITLNSKQLTTTGVTVSKPKTSAGTYELKLKTDGDYAVTTGVQEAPVTEWVTNKTTATYQEYYKGSYTVNDKGAIVYTKPVKTTEVDRTKVTPYATITGASGEVNATRWGSEFYINGEGLSEKVAVAGYKSADDDDKYSFRFLNDYNNAAITGSKLNDTITAQGDRLSITGGQGDDAIEFSTDASRTGNVFIYTAGDGNDVITNFTANDSIQIKSGFNAKTEYIDDGVITVVSGKKEGTITLKFIDDNEPDYITINGKSYPTSDPNSGSANVLLADNNYRLDAAQLSDIVQPAVTQYTPYDFDSGLGLTKEEKFTPEITFAKDDK